MLDEKQETIIRELEEGLPAEWIENRIKRDGIAHHITYIFKAKKIDPKGLDCSFHILGRTINEEAGVAFAPCLGSDGITYHVTLGFATVDKHDIDKGYSNMQKWYVPQIKDYLASLKEPDEFLKYLCTNEKVSSELQLIAQKTQDDMIVTKAMSMVTLES